MTHPRLILAALVLVIMLPLTGCPEGDEGDTIITNPPPSATKVVATANLDREAASCFDSYYPYDVIAHVTGLRQGVSVIAINVTSACGGSASIFGERGETTIVLRQCEPCDITASAVLSDGSATPFTVPAEHCAVLGCGEGE